jgi:hypothetical protein
MPMLGTHKLLQLSKALCAKVGKMTPHGYINLFWEGDILYLEAFGPFNEDGAVKAGNEYLNKIINRNVADFSIVETWDENSLSSPKGMAIVAELWAKLASNNCVSFALIVSNTTQRGVAEQFLPSIGKIFNNKEEAKIWILNNKANE